MRRDSFHLDLSGLFLLVLLFVATGCVSTERKPDPYVGATGPVALSTLLSRPLTWDKLDDLETWLARYGSVASGPERNSARLALADGRTTFVHRDQATVAAATLATRRQLARDEYQAVLADSGATSFQRERARTGLAQLGDVGRSGATLAAAPKATGALNIISRSSWGAAREVPRHMSRHVAPWNVITVHHSAMPLGTSTSFAGRAGEVRTIQRAHLNKPEGWGDIGYHFLIDPEGRVFEGRRLNWRGAHVGGMNDHNLGVCLLGNFNEDRPTAAAVASLQRLLDQLCAQNSIPRSQVRYHREWATANTECPGTALVPIVENYRRGRGATIITQAAPRPQTAKLKTSPPRAWRPTSSGKVQ